MKIHQYDPVGLALKSCLSGAGPHARVAVLAPNVAYYLDEQPLAQPGRNLDVYAADLQRIAVLSGPQGTRFGGWSPAGNVRLITNKPVSI